MVPNPPEPPVPLEAVALVVAGSPPEPDAVAVAVAVDAEPPTAPDATPPAPPDPLVPPAPVSAPVLLDPLLLTGSAVPHALTKTAAKAPRTRELDDDFTPPAYVHGRRGRNPVAREIPACASLRGRARASAALVRCQSVHRPKGSGLGWFEFLLPREGAPFWNLRPIRGS